MKKKILLLIGIFSVGVIKAQVGVNTNTPLGTFHIDGKKDNLSVPTTDQLLNDFIVTSDGDVGIGTITPSVKLEINTGGTPANIIPGFKLVDGNEGEGRTLVSDAHGVAKWQAKQDVALTWDASHVFTIPYAGIYLITLYLDDNNTTNAYTNKWVNPTLDNGVLFNGVALWSITRNNYLISNANSQTNYGVSCSGTLYLLAGERLRPGALAWNGSGTRILGVEIIPL